jgi:predicted AAA+ superfamily ATPase
VLYVQVTYLLVDEQTVKREYGALEAISDNYEKCVVSMDEVLLHSNKGIKHVQVWNLQEFIL